MKVWWWHHHSIYNFSTVAIIIICQSIHTIATLASARMRRRKGNKYDKDTETHFSSPADQRKCSMLVQSR